MTTDIEKLSARFAAEFKAACDADPIMKLLDKGFQDSISDPEFSVQDFIEDLKNMRMNEIMAKLRGEVPDDK